MRDDENDYKRYRSQKLQCLITSSNYSEYLADENDDYLADYSEYLAEQIDQNIRYSEYLASPIQEELNITLEYKIPKRISAIELEIVCENVMYDITDVGIGCDIKTINDKLIVIIEKRKDSMELIEETISRLNVYVKSYE